jgi:hypothetical protein
LAGVGKASLLWNAVREGGADAPPSEEEIELARTDLVCAWVDPVNDGVDDRIDAWHSAIDDNFNLIEANILKLLHHSTILKAMYTGKWADDTQTKNIAQKMADAGIDGDTYDCSACSEPTYGCTDGNELLDCSFESGSFAASAWGVYGNPGYYDIIDTEHYEGSYALTSTKGVGDYNDYVHQTFTCSAAGTFNLGMYQKSHSATYGPYFRLWKNDGGWSIVWEGNIWATRDGTWNYIEELSMCPALAGVQYQLQIFYNYYYIDNIKLWVS